MRERVAAMWRATRRHGVLGRTETGQEESREIARPELGSRPRRRGRAATVTVACAAAGLGLVVAACGPTGSTAAGGGTTPTDGGPVTWAMQPEQWPTYIFPFTSPSSFSITNQEYFQELMYRPLYWFGDGNQPVLNPQLSLAYAPVYSGHLVTIKLKPYRWSNGTPVSAQDVVFWMNMLKAEKDNWGGYVPGAFPDNVSDVTAVSPTEVTMRITKPYSPDWFTSNELSQITPLPLAWDRTAANTTSDCVADVSDCAAVYKYLTAQNAVTSTYASSPLWSVVDGPWKLKSFQLDGDVVFTSNRSYSGPLPAHHITTFIEEPFTTEQEEYNVLQAGGSGTHKLDVGYLPTVDAPVPASSSQAANNPLWPQYKLAAQAAWGLNYIPYDFNNPQVGPIFRQLYFRQALQYLSDQAGVISGPLHGYGTADVGPVGDSIVTRYLSPTLKRAGNQYPLDTHAATLLLSHHGWHVVPNQQATCVSPGTGPADCGPGIARGTPLKFTIDFVSGVSWVQSAVRELISNAAEVGITISASEGSFPQVTGQLGECAGITRYNAGCKWQLLDWGQGWTYSPDFLPTGEELFQTGATDNFGGYSSARNDHLIKQTLDTSAKSFYPDFYRWENYLSAQLPVVMEPETPYQLNETASTLHAPTEPPTLVLTPEEWYWTK
jgi:peptide/nickel transport system substrate-binding protein